MIVKDYTPNNIAERIDFWLKVNDEEKKKVSEKLQKYVLGKHSLNTLVDKLSELITVLRQRPIDWNQTEIHWLLCQ